jgi:hypothetical protein
MDKPPVPSASPSFFSAGWGEVLALSGLLTDLGFKRFITPKIVRTLYLLSLVAALLAAVTWTFSGFTAGVSQGVFTLVTGPLAFFIYTLTARVALEFVVAVIRVAENTDKLVQQSSANKP